MVARKTWELYETRVISGRGLFIIPVDDNLRHLYLYANIVRFPVVDWGSSKYNPDRSEYAKITWIRENYVLREDAVNYQNQRFQWACDPSATGYLATALACMYASTIDYLQYNFTYLGVPPPIPGDQIYIEPLRDAPTDIKIVCRGDTAIEFQLWKLDYDYACPEGLPTPKPPPDPPQPIPDPPGTPRDDISPPYSPPSDDGDSVPSDLDEFVPPEGGDTGDTIPGNIYAITYQVKQFPGGSVLTRGGILVLGVVGDIRFKPDGSKMTQIWCQGRVLNPFAPPPPAAPGWFDIQDEDDRAVDLVLTDVSPYP